MASFVLTAQLRLQAPTNLSAVTNQIQSQLQGITATVNVAVPAQAQASLKKANQNLRKTAKAAKEAENALENFGGLAALAAKRFVAFTIAGGAVVRLGGALINATKDAIAFERQMNRVQQVTGNSTVAIARLSDEISRLGSEYGVSSTELSKASLILAQAGLSAEDTRTSLEALAKTDLAPTFDSINNTTEGAIAVFRQFQIGASELEASLGSINAVAAKFAVESSDIIGAVRRTGGAFRAAGGDLNELIALFTSVRATTRESAESIATGFRTIFTRLQRVRTQNFLEQLGIDLQTFEGQFVGPYEAIRRLSAGLKNLEGTDPRFAQVIEELGGFRQISKVIPLIKQFDVSQRALNVALSGTDSLTENAATAQETLAVQIAKTREEFVAMIRSLTQTTAFQSTVKLALNFAQALIKVAESLRPILPLLTLFGAASFGRALGPIATGFKTKLQTTSGGFNEGGKVLTFNTGGAVPSLLTPGEIVFDPPTAKKVGYSTLNKVNKFAYGGMVPGYGNRDTVPAMLSPGSFVLRAPAVRALGFNQGGSVPKIQRLQEAGKVQKAATSTSETDRSEYGMLFLRTEGERPAEAITDREQFTVKTKSDQNHRATLIKSGFSQTFGDQFEQTISDVLVPLSNSLGDQLAGELGTKRSSKIANKAQLSNSEAIIGGMFESAIESLGVIGSTEQSPFDFPRGLKSKAKNWAAGAGLANIPVDAKRTLNSKNVAKMKSKIKTFIDEPERQGFTNTRLVNRIKEGDVDQTNKNILLTESESKRNAFKQAKALNERYGAGVFEAYSPGQNKPAILRRTPLRFNQGGQVPALLTPGEIVVPEPIARSVGYNTLSSMNQYDRKSRGGKIQKFNKGGKVQKFKLGGTVEGKDTPVSEGVGVITLYANDQITPGFKEDGVIRINKSVSHPGLPVNYRVMSFSNSFAKQFETSATKTLLNLNNRLGKKVGRELGVPSTNPLATHADIPNYSSMIGGLFEGALITLGQPFSSDQGAFDFPKGMRGRTKNWEGGAAISDIPVDAKRTWNDSNKNSIRKKITAIVDNPDLLAKAGTKNPWKKGQPYNAKRHNTALGLSNQDTKTLTSTLRAIKRVPGSKYNSAKIVTHPKTGRQTIRYAEGGEVQKFAKGGIVGKRTRFATGGRADKSPSLRNASPRTKEMHDMHPMQLVNLAEVPEFAQRFQLGHSAQVAPRVVSTILGNPNKDQILNFPPRQSKYVGSGVEAMVFSDGQQAYRIARKGVRGAPSKRPQSSAVLQPSRTQDFGNVYGEVLPLAVPTDRIYNKKYDMYSERGRMKSYKRHDRVQQAVLKRMRSEGFDASEGNVSPAELHEGNFGVTGGKGTGQPRRVKLIDPNIFRKYAQGGVVQKYARGGRIPPKYGYGFLPRPTGDIRRARRRRLDEEGGLPPQGKEYARRRNERFSQLGQDKQVQRVVGYIDGDVLADPANAHIVKPAIKKHRIKGSTKGYHDFLIKLARQKRKVGQLDKFKAVYGAPGAGKTSLVARKSPGDNARLRKTTRIPILTPEDIYKSTEVIDTVASSAKAIQNLKPGGLYENVDQFAVLSSSTKAEKQELLARRTLRQQQVAAGDPTAAQGRSAQAAGTFNAPSDTGAVEAVAHAELGKRAAILGIQPGFKTRRKGPNEIPTLEDKKIGVFYGAMAPATRGHAANAKLAVDAGIDPKDLIVAVSQIGGTAKKGDPHSQRTVIYNQSFRKSLAQASFPKATVVKSSAQDFAGTAQTVFERDTPKGSQRKFVRAAPGSVAFVGDDKAEPELAKYRQSGYNVQIGARNDISGTAAREAIMDNNRAQMKKMLTPGALKLVDANRERIQARTNVLPKLFDRADQRVGNKAEVINQELTQYPTQLTAKLRKDEPETASKILALRKKRDAVKKLKTKLPVRMLRELTRLFPQKYGFVDKYNTGGRVKDRLTVGEEVVSKEVTKAINPMAAQKPVEPDVSGRKIHFARGGSVPAMLTPGEMVVSPPAVQAIGAGRLSSFNRGGKIRKMAGGGLLGGGGGGLGDIATAGFALGGITAFVDSLEGVPDSIKEMLSAFTSVATQFFILSGVVSSVSSKMKQFSFESLGRKGVESKLKSQIGNRYNTKSERSDLLAQRQTINEERRQAKSRLVQVQRQRSRSTGAARTFFDDRLNTEKERIRTTGQRRNRVSAQLLENQRQLDQGQRGINFTKRVGRIGGALGTAGKYAGPIGLGAGIISQSVGGSFVKKGREKIQAGTGGETEFKLGTAFSTAGSTATIGATAGAVFGPWGIAIGAAVGGVYGLVTGLKNAEKELNNIKILKDFNESVSITSRTLKALASEQITLGDAKVKVDSLTSTTISSIRNPDTTPEARKDILAGVKGELDGLNTYLNKTAQESRTFGQFLDSAGEETLRLVAKLSNVSTYDLQEEFKKVQEAAEEARQSQTNLTKVQDEYAARIRDNIKVTKAFNTIALTMKRFDSSLTDAIGTLSDTTSVGRVTDNSALFSDPEKYFDPKLFAEILGRDIARNPALSGGLGDRIAKDIEDSEKAIRELPNILLGFRDTVAAFESDQIVDQLINQFEGSSDFVQTAIRRTAATLIGSELKDSALLEKLRTDFTGSLAKFNDAIKPAITLGALIVKTQNDELNRRLKYIDEINKVAAQELEARNKVLDTLSQIETIGAKAFNRPEDFNRLQALDTQKQANILGPDFKLINDPLRIQGELLKTTNSYYANRARLEKTEGEERKKIVKQLQSESQRRDRLNGALKFLADVGNRTAVTLKKIEKAQAAASFRTKTLDSALFASSLKEVRTLVEKVQVGRVAAATGNIDAIPVRLRGQLQSLLEETKGLGNLSIFGGRSSEDVTKQLRFNFATKLGASEKDATAYAEDTSTELEKQRQILNNQFIVASQASNLIHKNIDISLSTLADRFDSSMDLFAARLEASIANQEKAIIEDSLRKSQIEEKKTGKAQKGLDFLTSTGLNEEQAKNIINQVGAVEQARKDRVANRELTEFRTNTFGLDRDLIRSQLGFADEDSLYNMETTSSGSFAGGLSYRTEKIFTRTRADELIEKQKQNLIKRGADERSISLFDQKTGDALDNATEDTFNAVNLIDLIDKATQAVKSEAAARGGQDAAEKSLLANDISAKTIDVLIDSEESLKKFKEAVELYKLDPQPLEKLNKTLDGLSKDIKLKQEEIKKLSLRADAASGLADSIAIATGRDTALLEEIAKNTRAQNEEKEKGRNAGGWVYGQGIRDTVPARLTPGEFVLSRQMVSNIGKENVAKLAKGGLISSAYNYVKNLLVDEEEEPVIDRNSREFKRNRYIQEKKERRERYLQGKQERRGQVEAPEERTLGEKIGGFFGSFGSVIAPTVDAITGTFKVSDEEKEKAQNRERAERIAAGGRRVGDKDYGDVRVSKNRLPDEERKRRKAQAERIASNAARVKEQIKNSDKKPITEDSMRESLADSRVSSLRNLVRSFPEYHTNEDKLSDPKELALVAQRFMQKRNEDRKEASLRKVNILSGAYLDSKYDDDDVFNKDIDRFDSLPLKERLVELKSNQTKNLTTRKEQTVQRLLVSPNIGEAAKEQLRKQYNIPEPAVAQATAPTKTVRDAESSPLYGRDKSWRNQPGSFQELKNAYPLAFQDPYYDQWNERNFAVSTTPGYHNLLDSLESSEREARARIESAAPAGIAPSAGLFSAQDSISLADKPSAPKKDLYIPDQKNKGVYGPRLKDNLSGFGSAAAINQTFRETKREEGYYDSGSSKVDIRNRDRIVIEKLVREGVQISNIVTGDDKPLSGYDLAVAEGVAYDIQREKQLNQTPEEKAKANKEYERAVEAGEIKPRSGKVAAVRDSLNATIAKDDKYRRDIRDYNQLKLLNDLTERVRLSNRNPLEKAYDVAKVPFSVAGATIGAVGGVVGEAEDLAREEAKDGGIKGYLFNKGASYLGAGRNIVQGTGSALGTIINFGKTLITSGTGYAAKGVGHVTGDEEALAFGEKAHTLSGHQLTDTLGSLSRTVENVGGLGGNLGTLGNPLIDLANVESALFNDGPVGNDSVNALSLLGTQEELLIPGGTEGSASHQLLSGETGTVGENFTPGQRRFAEGADFVSEQVGGFLAGAGILKLLQKAGVTSNIAKNVNSYADQVNRPAGTVGNAGNRFGTGAFFEQPITPAGTPRPFTPSGFAGGIGDTIGVGGDVLRTGARGVRKAHSTYKNIRAKGAPKRAAKRAAKQQARAAKRAAQQEAEAARIAAQEAEVAAAARVAKPEGSGLAKSVKKRRGKIFGSKTTHHGQSQTAAPATIRIATPATTSGTVSESSLSVAQQARRIAAKKATKRAVRRRSNKDRRTRLKERTSDYIDRTFFDQSEIPATTRATRRIAAEPEGSIGPQPKKFNRSAARKKIKARRAQEAEAVIDRLKNRADSAKYKTSAQAEGFLQQWIEQNNIKTNVRPKVIVDDARFTGELKDAFALSSGDTIIMRSTGIGERSLIHEFTHAIGSGKGLEIGAKFGEQLGYRGYSGRSPFEVNPRFNQMTKELQEMVKQTFSNPKDVVRLNDPFELFATVGENADVAPRMFARMRKMFNFQTGSMVPGFGSGDKVPALLEPGEFVLNRNAVAAIGAGNIARVNDTYKRFQSGGSVRSGAPVKMQSGGAVAGIDLSLMQEVVQKFGTYVDKFGSFADSINGLEISMKATHTVEVILNGGSVLAGMEESIRNMVVAETNKAINHMLDTKLGLPPMDK